MQTELSAKIFGDKEDPRTRLESIFGAHPAAREWAIGALTLAGVETSDTVLVIKQLRTAEPRLTLKAATYLAEDVRRA